MNENQIFFEKGFITGMEEGGLDKYAAAGFVYAVAEMADALNAMSKKADLTDTLHNWGHEGVSQLPQNIQDMIHQGTGSTNQTLGYGAGGGGIGAILGNLLFPNNPMMGTMLGGLGGAGIGGIAGHYMPQIIDWFTKHFGHSGAQPDLSHTKGPLEEANHPAPSQVPPSNPNPPIATPAPQAQANPPGTPVTPPGVTNTMVQHPQTPQAVPPAPAPVPSPQNMVKPPMQPGQIQPPKL